MKKVYLGIFCHGSHDSAVVFLSHDGKVLFAAEEERYDRKKHSSSFPTLALKAGMEQLAIGWESVESVAFAWDPFLHLPRVAFFLFRGLPNAFRFVFRKKHRSDSRIRKWFEMRNVPARLRSLGFRGDVTYISHHHCHAASAFFASSFPEAACISVDGNGEFACTTISRGGSDGIHLLWEELYPNSLGHFFSSLTQFLGFMPMNDEYKVMGLAGFGSGSVPAEITKAFADILRILPDGSYELDLRYFCFQQGREKMWSPLLEKALGPGRVPGSTILDRHKWIAAAAQSRLEEALLGLCRKAKSLVGSDNLCVAGGVGLNCVANERVRRDGPFQNLFFQPASHDSGTALGAAYLVWQKAHVGQRPQPPDNYYLGSNIPVASYGRLLESRGARKFSDRELEELVAREIAAGKVVAWYQGAMEFGPRALGSRSLLADPRTAESREKMNLVIKKRESFRPFAPVVCAPKAETYFELGGVPSPYMMRTVPIRPEFRDRLAGVTHVDGSARVQTLEEKDNPLLYGLLEAFGRITTFPILLNSSLNRNFEPIVCKPEEALALFDETALDLLVMGPYVLQRP